ncbi:MAG: alanine--tRNA ligase-related protein, partial [Rikenellaceae bacterium]
FVLYDTYGFPIDLTELIAKEQGVEVDLEAFEKELAAQKERSRNAAAIDADDWQELLPIKQSEFVGYDSLRAEVKIARYRRVTSKNKTVYQLVFDRTPFYGNSGGQIGDTGYIESGDEKIEVVATEKENGQTIHIVAKLPENLESTFVAQVCEKRRQNAANNHTATHLLHHALREVLGDHVEQKGSLVTPETLRFDFSHFQKVTAEELRAVEIKVNAAIRANAPLEENREASQEEAAASGAMMLFGEKYGDRVRVIRFGDSVELCGGTHTSATGTIGLFKIVSEGAISAGVRRIEATSGEGAEKLIYMAEDMVKDISTYVNNNQVLQAVKKLVDNNDALSKEVEAMRKEQTAEWAEKLLKNTPEQDGVILISGVTSRMADFQKDVAYNLRSKAKNVIYVAGSNASEKPMLTIMLGDDIVAKGINAGQIIREAAKEMQGGGGGQPFFATAGGKKMDGLLAAVEKAVELIKEKL